MRPSPGPVGVLGSDAEPHAAVGKRDQERLYGCVERNLAHCRSVEREGQQSVATRPERIEPGREPHAVRGGTVAGEVVGAGQVNSDRLETGEHQASQGACEPR